MLVNTIGSSCIGTFRSFSCSSKPLAFLRLSYWHPYIESLSRRCVVQGRRRTKSNKTFKPVGSRWPGNFSSTSKTQSFFSDANFYLFQVKNDACSKKGFVRAPRRRASRFRDFQYPIVCVREFTRVLKTPEK